MAFARNINICCHKSSDMMFLTRFALFHTPAQNDFPATILQVFSKPGEAIGFMEPCTIPDLFARELDMNRNCFKSISTFWWAN